MRHRNLRSSFAAWACLALARTAAAQWNPPLGQWGKIEPTDVRVMTWNIQDGICRTAHKVEGLNSWCALARIVAALRPDVLILQEAGDNEGNGTGLGVDSSASLAATLQLFVRGGIDRFHGDAPVSAYVQKYAPGYELPFVFVPGDTDGFNRNAIASRFPFVDRNGDGRATYHDIPKVTATQYAPGGDGGLRGFQLAEIDLPDATYRGDLVVGNAHLRSGTALDDHAARITSAQNVAYVVRFWLGGNGGRVPDPEGKVQDRPAATQVLGPHTAVVLGGDWNEDERTNGTRGPADWLARAALPRGTLDGTDRDGSDATIDGAVHPFTGSRTTFGSGKRDYIVWQDSIAVERLSAVFHSTTNPIGTQPLELAGFPAPHTASGFASDHRPVLVDFVLPIVDCNGNGAADSLDLERASSVDANANGTPDECETIGATFCSGDGSLATPCPCAPPHVVPMPSGSPGHGCANAQNSAGAQLVATGTTAPDTLVLRASIAPSYAGFAFALKGTALAPDGVAAGDGIRCVSGALIRFGSHVAGSHGEPLGTWTYPNRVQATPISVATAQPAAQSAFYQLVYRHAAPDFCSPSTVSYSNGCRVDWP